MRRLLLTISVLPSIFHRTSCFNSGKCSTTAKIKSKAATITTDNENDVLTQRQQQPQQQQQKQKYVTPPLPPIPPGFIAGPPLDTKPRYEEIHGPLGPFLDRLFLIVFRSKMAEKIGIDSDLPADDYQGLMELTAAMNARFSDRTQVHDISQNVLRSLFPSWLPGAFSWMFAKPFPVFSARMNAWATMTAGIWLMGECELNDCEIDGGKTGLKQGVLVKRCRFLEESGCASVCVNSCKIPTQRFFEENMGLPLTMTPDYETGECQFSFGLSVSEEAERDAKDTPCLGRCPSAGGMRKWHQGESSTCPMMDEDTTK